MTGDETDGSPEEPTRHGSAPSRRRILAGLCLGGATIAGYRGSRGRSGRRDPRSTTRTSWEDRADERIERHRTTDLDVIVTDGRGCPLPDARVDVTMRRHEFGFGTAVNAEHLVRRTTAGDEYRTALTRLFNKAVLENHHKWGFWAIPEDRTLAERATEWLLARGLEMRGHTCIWQKRGQGAIPDDVTDAMDAGDGAYVAERARTHISDIVGHYRDVPGFTEWDVLNEQVEEHGMTDLIDPDEPSTEAPVLLDWYRAAAEADPDVQLYINEYSVLAGDETAHRDAFEAIVEHLLDGGAPLGGLGLQGHHWSPEQRRTPEELLATLDRFAALVPAIQVHEYDTWGEDWTERMEATYLHRFLKTLYSHPAAEGFLMWGFWDGIHWQGNAPLFRTDWSRKPTYDVYTDLVFDRWWTDERGRAGTDGVYSTTAFLGKYDLEAHANGDTVATTVTLDDPTGRTTVPLVVDE